jgi:hypothetical protein
MPSVHTDGFDDYPISNYGMSSTEGGTGTLLDVKSDTRWVTAPDPRYVGLNRAQRRQAMAVENRAFRKRMKKRV